MKQAGRCWVDVCHCYIDVRTDPWGLQPSTPLKAINLWPTVPCTVPSIASLSNTHTLSVYCIQTKGGIYKKVTLWPSVLHCKQHNLICKEGICVLNLSLPYVFYLVCAWVFVVKRPCVQFLWIIFNSLQSASRGHSQHSVQTDSTHTHSHVNAHTQTTAVRYKAKGEAGQVRAREAAVEREDERCRERDERKSRQNIRNKNGEKKRERRVNGKEWEW